jgi:hypothetical protein
MGQLRLILGPQKPLEANPGGRAHGTADSKVLHYTCIQAMHSLWLLNNWPVPHC